MGWVVGQETGEMDFQVLPNMGSPEVCAETGARVGETGASVSG